MSAQPAIELHGLTKTFGRGEDAVHAVIDLDLRVPRGQVYGFLGHNGAGKTTTIRMIMDLIRPTAGRVAINGRDVRADRAVLSQVGALVEHPTFYDFLSGRANLEVLARTASAYSTARIDALLAQVKLTVRAGQPVKDYSTGMKQRLALAAALLSDPDLVILDEPTSGLDPSGILEMRHFLRDLVHEQGKTVFLSSHILSEVEQICDRVAIIRQGKLIREGLVADLLGARSELHLEVNDSDRAASLLAERWAVASHDDGLTVTAAREDAPHVIRRLVDADIDVYQMRIRKQSLEDFFLQATGQGEEPGDA